MQSRCLLCDRPTGIGEIGSMVKTGDAVRPNLAVLCTHCVARRPEEREPLRDQAMVRMLRSGGDPSGLWRRTRRGSRCTVDAARRITCVVVPGLRRRLGLVGLRDPAKGSRHDEHDDRNDG